MKKNVDVITDTCIMNQCFSELIINLYSRLNRDLREARNRYDTVTRENLKKEKQVRDLQQRLESGDGCK